jgi:hypothetical protein
MSRNDQRLIDAVAERLLLPIVAGGELIPVRPIGAERALRVASASPIASCAASLDISEQRLRRARQVYPLDELDDPSPSEWLLAFALNDILQSSNPTLGGALARTRPQRLLSMVYTVILAAGAPQSVGEALARHASFGRTLEIVRVDSEVSWWLGSRNFHGMRPPARLLAWPGLRRVQRRQRRVGLWEMTPAESRWAGTYAEVLTRFLAATPLTDLATAARAAPTFAWTGATLSLVATRVGANIAGRAVELGTSVRDASHAVRRAAKGLAPEPRRAARRFAEELRERAQREGELTS